MHPIGIAYKWRERIGELTKENKELKKTLAAAEERGKELEGMVEDEIYSRDFYRRKLAAAETKLEAVRGVIEQSEDYWFSRTPGFRRMEEKLDKLLEDKC